MKFVLKTVANGLLIGTILLGLSPTTASSTVVQSPVISIQKVKAVMASPPILQYTTNLSSPVWQTLGTFWGSTNVPLWNLPVVFLRGICTDLTVSATLAWPPSSDPSVTGYRLYYGTSSGNYTNSIDVGLTTSATISNLIAGKTYYFAVRAYTSSGVQSAFSNEAGGSFKPAFSLAITGMHRVGSDATLTVTQVVTTSASTPVPMVITKQISADVSNPVTLQFTTNLSSPNWQTLGTFSGTTNVAFTNLPAVFFRGACTNLPASATLAWWPSSDPTVAGYKLYYGTASHTYTSVINVGNATTETVSNLVSGQTYYFAVTAYDSSGLESQFSNEASGAFKAAFSLTIGSP